MVMTLEMAQSKVMAMVKARLRATVMVSLELEQQVRQLLVIL
jgi:hypothetical protein